jgi:hypothetical protein
LNLGPFSETKGPNVVGLDAHATELVESALTLPNNSAFKGDEHEEREERIVPILIEEPEADAEDLENEEWRNSMLLEELGEGGNGNIERVCSVMLLDSGELRLLLEAPEGLVVADGGLGLGIDVISERRERFGLDIVEEAALLEEE